MEMCGGDWDAAVRVAVEGWRDEQGQEGKGDRGEGMGVGKEIADVEKMWPWLVKRPFQCGWYEERGRQMVEGLVRQEF